MSSNKKYFKKYIPLFYKLKAIICILFFPYKKWDQYKKLHTKVKTYRQPTLIMTILVKNEGDILEKNLKFHKQKGIDGFIITDNGSSDNTLNIINKYYKKGWILERIIEKNQNYKQADWVHRMDLIAIKKYHADWIINCDADEFFYTEKNSIKDCLDPLYKVIYVRNHAMLSLEKNWINNIYKVENNLPVCLKAKLVLEGKISQFPQLVVSHKAIVLASAYKKVTVGNHYCDASDFNDLTTFSNDMIIYHYSYRGLEHFKRKVIEGAKVVESNKNYISKDVGSHWQYFYDEYLKKNLNLEKEFEKVNGSLALNDLLKYKIVVKDDKMMKILKSI